MILPHLALFLMEFSNGQELYDYLLKTRVKVTLSPSAHWINGPLKFFYVAKIKIYVATNDWCIYDNKYIRKFAAMYDDLAAHSQSSGVNYLNGGEFIDNILSNLEKEDLKKVITPISARLVLKLLIEPAPLDQVTINSFENAKITTEQK